MGIIVERALAATFVVVGLYLILKNPDADKTLLGGLSNGYNNAVKALQGR